MQNPHPVLGLDALPVFPSVVRLHVTATLQHRLILFRSRNFSRPTGAVAHADPKSGSRLSIGPSQTSHDLSQGVPTHAP